MSIENSGIQPTPRWLKSNTNNMVAAMKRIEARRMAIAKAAAANLAALRELYPYSVHSLKGYELRRDASRWYVLLDVNQGLIRDRRRGLTGCRELARHMAVLAA